jgi:peptide/nickel transport system permease protein
VIGAVRGLTFARRAGLAGLAMVAALALVAPLIAPQNSGEQFPDRVFAPPMRIYVHNASGFQAPFVYGQVLENRVERRFGRGAAVPLRWFGGGRLVSTDRGDGPLLLLGGDALGRDVFSRLLYGARLSLGVTALGALCALLIGSVIGGFAGALGGRVETLLMMIADFVLVLPGVYLVLVLRAMLPQTLTTAEVFWLMVLLFGVAGWPHVARGVRAVLAVERESGYAEAARALGVGPIRLVAQLLPAAGGFLAVEVALLIPALLVAEATISFLGLGFPEPAPSWGTMLQEAGNVSGLVTAPWILAPAAALFAVVLSVQMMGGSQASENQLLVVTKRIQAP